MERREERARESTSLIRSVSSKARAGRTGRRSGDRAAGLGVELARTTGPKALPSPLPSCVGVGVEPDDGLGRVFPGLEARRAGRGSRRRRRRLRAARRASSRWPRPRRTAAGWNQSGPWRGSPSRLAGPEHDVDPRRDRAGTDVGGVRDLERGRRPVGRGRAGAGRRRPPARRLRSATAVGKHGAGSGIVARGPLASVQRCERRSSAGSAASRERARGISVEQPVARQRRLPGRNAARRAGRSRGSTPSPGDNSGCTGRSAG